MIMKKLIIAFLVFGLIPICAKTQTTVTITNCVDARVDSDQPNANFGSHYELSVYSKYEGVTKNSRAYLRFLLDTSQIPANANIISAKLYLYRNGNPEFAQPYSHTGNNQLKISRTIGSINFSMLTWNTQPSTTTTNQVSIPKSSSPFQHLEADVTDIIRDIYESGNNFGMSLQLQDETPDKSWSFCASEHPNSALRPKLVVTYVANRQIILNREMIYANYLTRGEGAKPIDSLIDEQGSNVPLTKFQLPAYYDTAQINIAKLTNAEIIIDLNDSFELDNVSFYDTYNSDTIFIYTGNLNSWTYSGFVFTGTYNTWINLNLNQAKSRYLKIVFRSNLAIVNEIKLYGKLHKINSIKNSEIIKKQYTLPKIEELLGVNGHWWDSAKYINCGGNFREYRHLWWNDGGRKNNYFVLDSIDLGHTYTGYPNNKFAFSDTIERDYREWPWGSQYENFYRNWKDSGNFTILATIQGSPFYINPGKHELVIPTYPNQNKNDANSYKAHADFMYQFTARFGSVKFLRNKEIDLIDDKLRLRTPNSCSPRTGLNYINYIENWNEPDNEFAIYNNLHLKDKYFTPFNFAAMCSMDFDGHEKSDTTVGAKNADSTTKFVMGSLMEIDIDYLKSMKLWFDNNRTDKIFASDVINVHHYSRLFKKNHPTIDSIGISPEQDSLKYRLKKLVDFRNNQLPDKEIWLTEFGYDTDTPSALLAPQIGPYNTEETQGRWLLRSFLEIAAAGIDKAYWFQISDNLSGVGYKFSSTGLVTSNYTRIKPSWYYMKGMKETLKGSRFSKELASGNPNINLYEFKTDNNDTIIYAVWCNTSNNTVINNYKLGIGKEQCKVEYILPYANHSLWHTSNLTVAADSVVIDSITELVTFIRVIKPRITTNLLATVNHTGLYTENKICKGDSVYHLYLTQFSPICRYWIEVFRIDTNIAYSGNYGKQSNSVYKLYDSTTALPQQFSFPGFYFEAGAVYKIIFRAKNCNDTCIIQVNEFEISVPFKVSIEAVKVNVSEQLLANSLGAVVKLKGIMKGFNAITDSFEWWPPSGLSYPNNLRDSLNQIANYIEGVDSITYFLYGKSTTDCYDTAQFTLKHNKLAFVNNTNDTLCLNNNNLIMGNRIEESLIFGVLYYLSGGPGQQFHQNLNSNTWQYIYGAQNYQGLSGFLLSESAKNLMSSKPALQIFLENRDNWFEFYNRSWYANYINEFYFGDRDVALNNFYSEINNDGTLTNYLNPNNLNNYQWDDSHINDIHELLLLFLDNKTSTWVPYDQYTYILVETIPFESSWEYANFELDETQNNLTWFDLPNANATNWNNHFIVNHSPIKNTKYRFTVIDNINSFIEYDIKSVFIDTTTVIPYFQPYVQTDTSTIYFVNLSEPFNVTTHFEWNFGDGSDASTEPDPLHTFPKSDSTYWVCMTLFNKCITNGLQWCDSIRVNNNQNGLLSQLPPDKPLNFNTKLNQDELRGISKNGLIQELEQKINKNKKVAHKGIRLTAMPNPFSQYTTIHYQIDELNEKAAIELTNSIGITVYKDEITTAEGSKVIHNNGLAKGIYHCRIFNQNHSTAIKLVIE